MSKNINISILNEFKLSYLKPRNFDEICRGQFRRLQIFIDNIIFSIRDHFLRFCFRLHHGFRFIFVIRTIEFITSIITVGNLVTNFHPRNTLPPCAASIQSIFMAVAIRCLVGTVGTVGKTVAVPRHGNAFSIPACPLSTIGAPIVAWKLVLAAITVPNIVATMFHLDTFVVQTAELFRPATGKVKRKKGFHSSTQLWNFPAGFLSISSKNATSKFSDVIFSLKNCLL